MSWITEVFGQLFAAAQMNSPRDIMSLWSIIHILNQLEIRNSPTPKDGGPWTELVKPKTPEVNLGTLTPEQQQSLSSHTLALISNVSAQVGAYRTAEEPEYQNAQHSIRQELLSLGMPPETIRSIENSAWNTATELREQRLQNNLNTISTASATLETQIHSGKQFRSYIEKELQNAQSSWSPMAGMRVQALRSDFEAEDNRSFGFENAKKIYEEGTARTQQLLAEGKKREADECAAATNIQGQKELRYWNKIASNYADTATDIHAMTAETAEQSANTVRNGAVGTVAALSAATAAPLIATGALAYGIGTAGATMIGFGGGTLVGTGTGVAFGAGEDQIVDGLNGHLGTRSLSEVGGQALQDAKTSVIPAAGGSAGALVSQSLAGESILPQAATTTGAIARAVTVGSASGAASGVVSGTGGAAMSAATAYTEFSKENPGSLYDPAYRAKLSSYLQERGCSLGDLSQQIFKDTIASTLGGSVGGGTNLMRSQGGILRSLATGIDMSANAGIGYGMAAADGHVSLDEVTQLTTQAMMGDFVANQVSHQHTTKTTVVPGPDPIIKAKESIPHENSSGAPDSSHHSENSTAQNSASPENATSNSTPQAQNSGQGNSAAAPAQNQNSADAKVTPSTEQLRRDRDANDPVGAVARKQIGNIADIIRNDDIIAKSALDEKVPGQKNYLHGALQGVEQLAQNAANNTPTSIAYIEAHALTAANSVGDHAVGDKLVELANTTARDFYREIDPDALVFRGPNAGIIVQSSKLSPEQLAQTHEALQKRLAEAISKSNRQGYAKDSEQVRISDQLRSVKGAEELRIGATEIPSSTVDLPPDAMGLLTTMSDASRDSLKTAYFRGIAEAGAAAEFGKRIKTKNGTGTHTFKQVLESGNYASADEAVIDKYNFVPPEARAGTFYDMYDQKQEIYQSWDKLTGPMTDRDAQRAQIADMLSKKPATPEEVQNISEARQALVAYQAMAQRPPRFEGNAWEVHEGRAVPILNLNTIDGYEKSFVDAGQPYMRADGDFDFLRDGFDADRADLKSGKVGLEDSLRSADNRVGQFFEKSAASLRTLEESVNTELAQEGKTPVRFFIGKQSTSDEYRVVAAGESVTPEIMQRAMNTVRDSVEAVGLERPFPKVHKVTGQPIAESGGTTTSLGTTYEPITTEEQRQSIGHTNDQIVKLRKFIPEKNTSGNLQDLTPDQVQGIQRTMNQFLDFASGVFERPAPLEPATLEQQNKAKNALEEMRKVLEEPADPSDPKGVKYNDILEAKGMDRSRIESRLKKLIDRYVPEDKNVEAPPATPKIRNLPKMANAGMDPFGGLLGKLFSPRRAPDNDFLGGRNVQQEQSEPQLAHSLGVSAETLPPNETSAAIAAMPTGKAQVIGRGGNIVVPGDESVSRAHAVIVKNKDGSLTIRDGVKSGNGTFIEDTNGALTPVPNSFTKLQPGTVVQCGSADTKLVIPGPGVDIASLPPETQRLTQALADMKPNSLKTLGRTGNIEVEDSKASRLQTTIRRDGNGNYFFADGLPPSGHGTFVQTPGSQEWTRVQGETTVPPGANVRLGLEYAFPVQDASAPKIENPLSISSRFGIADPEGLIRQDWPPVRDLAHLPQNAIYKASDGELHPVKFTQQSGENLVMTFENGNQRVVTPKEMNDVLGGKEPRIFYRREQRGALGPREDYSFRADSPEQFEGPIVRNKSLNEMSRSDFRSVADELQHKVDRTLQDYRDQRIDLDTAISQLRDPKILDGTHFHFAEGNITSALEDEGHTAIHNRMARNAWCYTLQQNGSDWSGGKIVLPYEPVAMLKSPDDHVMQDDMSVLDMTPHREETLREMAEELYHASQNLRSLGGRSGAVSDFFKNTDNAPQYDDEADVYARLFENLGPDLVPVRYGNRYPERQIVERAYRPQGQ